MNVCVRIATLATFAVLASPMVCLHAQSAPAPKVELFLGYTHFGAFSSPTTGTAGNRMVGLNGGSVSLAFNLNRYVGIVGDFGGYDDSQLQLTGSGANQPRTVSSNGTAFTYMGGPRISWRNTSRFTPFAQVLVGGVHGGPVTIANCSGAVCVALPSQNALALTAGGGLDIRLTRHVTLRPVQAEYMMTRFANVTAGVSGGSSATQNDLRLSTGLVLSFGGKGRTMLPIQLACGVTPSTGFAGNSFVTTVTATNLNVKRQPAYSYTTTGGVITSNGASATIDTTGLAPGSYVVTANVAQGDRVTNRASCTASYTIQAMQPPTVSCVASPDSVKSGDTSTITAQAVSPQNRALVYSYVATAGTIGGTETSTTLSTAGVEPGQITVSCNVVDDLGKTATANVAVTVVAPPVAVAPQTRELCALSFERDRKRPVRVDNEAKGCLDAVALQMQRESDARLVIVADSSADEKPEAATERGLNVRQYLVKDKGLDAARIEVRTGPADGRSTTNVFVPTGATYPTGDTVVVKSER